MSFVMGYRNLCILSGLYGVGFGGFRFSFKMLALECIKTNFSKIWSYIHSAEAMPILISVPLTIFLNDYSMKYGRAGYYICSAAAAIAAITLFFINHSPSQHNQRYHYQNHHGQPLTVQFKPQLNEDDGVMTQGRSMSIQLMNSKFHNEPNIIQEGRCKFVNPNFINRSCVSLNQIESGTSMYDLEQKASRCFYNNRSQNSSPSHSERLSRYHHSCTGCGNNHFSRSLSFMGNVNDCEGDSRRRHNLLYDANNRQWHQGEPQ